MAQRTGLEPATPGVTGRYSNRLNYRCASAGLTPESQDLLLAEANSFSVSSSPCEARNLRIPLYQVNSSQTFLLKK